MQYTPLMQAVQNILKKDYARFHTPGHKGSLSGFLSQCAPFDITEIRGADSLFSADGAIAETEARYTSLYHTAATLLSAGGSTLCIQAMLRLVAQPGKSIILGRNAHHSAVNTLALLDMTPKWIYPSISTDQLPAPISAQQVEQCILQTPDAVAVYLTSPDYFGKLADISAISQVCHTYGLPLLVDNAHGAELAFLPSSQHPIHLGADLCCDSLHKTMPVLTGGALLHIADTSYCQQHHCAARAKDAMALFGSTSPSYLILLSIDTLLPYLESGQAADDIQCCILQAEQLQKQAALSGFLLPCAPCLPTRLSLGFSSLGMTRNSFDQLTIQYQIEPEYLAEHYCVFLLSAQNRSVDFQRLHHFIQYCAQHAASPRSVCAALPQAQALLSPRQSMFAPAELVPLEHCLNKISAQTVSKCPPGIPLVFPGEKIDANLLEELKNYGISALTVVK